MNVGAMIVALASVPAVAQTSCSDRSVFPQPCSGASTQLAAADYQAWIAFYDALDLTNLPGGCTKTDPCGGCTFGANACTATASAQCVSCKAIGTTQHITKMSFPDQMLTGTIPNAISGFSQLRYLDLSAQQNKITGSIPGNAIKTMKQLTTLCSSLPLAEA